MKLTVNNECGSSVVVDFKNDSEGLTLNVRPVDKPVSGKVADTLRMDAGLFGDTFARGGYVGKSDAMPDLANQREVKSNIVDELTTRLTEIAMQRDQARSRILQYQLENERLLKDRDNFSLAWNRAQTLKDAIKLIIAENNREPSHSQISRIQKLLQIND